MARRLVRKILKTVLFTLLGMVGVLGLAVGTVAVYLNYRQQEIKQIVVGEINKYLDAPVRVKAIDVSLFRHFPLISVSFDGVNVQAVDDPDNEDVLNADGISLTFNIRDVVHKNYVVRDVIVQGGDLNLKHYGKGRNNFEIWKKNAHPSKRPLRFFLRRVQLNNTLVRWRDISKNHEYQVFARNMAARGNLFDSLQAFDLKGDVLLHNIQVSGKPYLVERKAFVDLEVANNRAQKNFEVNKGVLNLEGLNFDVTGYVHYEKKKAGLSYDIVGKKLNVNRLVAMLPASVRPALSDYNFKGKADFDLKIAGDYTKGPLQIGAGFAYKDGTIAQKSSGIKMENVELKGTYSNGSRQHSESSKLHLETLKASLPEGFVDGQFTLENFVKPEVAYKGSVKADLARLQTFLKLWPAMPLHGSLDAEIDFKNRFSSLHPKKWGKDEFLHAVVSGILDSRCLVLDLGNNKIVRIDSLRAGLSKQGVNTEAFTVVYGGERAEMRVSFDNLLSFLFLHENRLQLKAGVKSDGLTVENWLDLWETFSAVWSSSQKKKSVNESAATRFDSDGNGGGGERLGGSAKKVHWHADVELDVDKFKFRNFELTQVKGSVVYTPAHIRFSKLSFGCFQGDFSGSLSLGKEKCMWKMLLKGYLSNINVNACFKAFNNFGQTQITYENIWGRLGADFTFRGVYDRCLKRWPLDEVVLDADLGVKDGRLKGVESLKKIARFTGENDLQDIRFKDLATKIEIAGERIQISRMKVASDALDLSFEGSHTFHNEVDYLLNIELSDLLSRNRATRRAGKDEEFGVEIRDDGRARLPLTVKGVLPKVEIKYALKVAVEGARERLRENRKEFREALNAEFEDFNKKREERREEKELMKRQENGEFIIEVEDDDEPGAVGTEAVVKPDKKPVKNGSKNNNKKKNNSLEGFRIEVDDE